MLGGVYLYMRYEPIYALVGTVAMRDGTAPASVHTPTPTPSPTTSMDQAARTIAVAPVVRSVNDVFMLLLVISVAVFIVLAIVGAVIGWILAGRMLRPLQAINAVAQRAAEGDLRQRIDSDGPRDELRDLSETLDEMLATLERSFGEHQRFAANASHELRTPIATTQTLLEVALSDPDLDLPTLRTVAGRVYEMNRRNQETVESLLALADVEGARLDLEPVNLRSLTLEALQLEERAIADRGLDVRADLPQVIVTGDRVLLTQAIRNLVQNAVRHNLDGGRLSIRLTQPSRSAVLTVENDGPAVAPAIVSSLVEPFVRGAGRVAGTGPRGHGLGLALVQSVSVAHGASLEVLARSGGGLRVVLSFPRAGDR
jgi:two-component system sensor histidine kinase VanS